MLYQVIEDGEIVESYGMPDHDDNHHLTSAGFRSAFTSTFADITLNSSYCVLLVDTSLGNRVITLPPAASHIGRIYNIKKSTVDANTVTIDGNGAELIDFAATLVISVYKDSYSIISSGTGWFII